MFILQKSHQALEQTAQGGGGVTIPEGVPEPWRCGTEGCGQRARRGGMGLDLVISEVFSNLNYSWEEGGTSAFP